MARIVRSSDADIYYDLMGDGPPIVLLHPFPANHLIWRDVAEALSDSYRFILVDLRGHGDSTLGEGPATMNKHAEDIRRVCDDARVARAIFAGESIGGYALFEFWRRYRQRVSGLVLCNTRAGADSPEARAARLQSADEVLRTGPEPFIETTIPKLIGATTQRNRPDLVDAVRKMMSRMSAEAIAQVQRGMAERPDSVPTLATIDAATLVIAGEEDTATPIAEAEAIRSGIRGSQLRVIPMAGHYAVFEQSDATVAALRPFLGSLRGRV